MGPRHKTLRIAGVALAVVLVVAGGMVGYAAYNLTAVIARNQTRIVYRASKALGRPVQIAHIKAAVGLGLAIEVDDLKIADDPAFSREPFLDAAQASFEVEFLPLLKGRVKVQKLELVRPAIRILRRADGQLNVDTLGGSSNPQAAAHGGAKGAASAIIWSIAREVSIKGLGLDDGTIYYSDAALKGVPLQINHLTIEMAGFHSGSPFDLDIKAALFNDQPNLSLSGKM